MTDLTLATTASITVVICFLLYHFASLPTVYHRLASNSSTVGMVVFQRVTGFILLGLIPFILLLISGNDIFQFGLAKPGMASVLLAIVAAIMLVVPVTYKNSSKKENLAKYPQMRINEWNARYLFLTTSTWILYLIAYEFLFRGLLFFATIHLLGFWGAALLNAVLYALAHLPKGKKETIASLPFGIILCAIAFYTGNMWAAFILHVFLAVSNDIFSIAAQPDMKYSGTLRGFNIYRRI